MGFAQPRQALDLAQAATPDSAPSGWWRVEDGVDYGIVAGSLAAVLALHSVSPLDGIGIGPRFDPVRPADVLDPRLAPDIGRPYAASERIPPQWLSLAVPVVGVGLALDQFWATDGDPRAVHDTVVGLSEAVAWTLLATEVLKFGVGRLRPDFADRVLRTYCYRPDSAGVDCSGDVGPPLGDSAAAADLLAEGRRSFPSGHASTSFALAAYGVWALGARWVWAPEATAGSRAAGLVMQAGLLGGASAVAWSRVADGRHNVSDVLAGAAVGATLASVAWWRKFDLHGRSRRGLRLGLTPDSSGGVQVTLFGDL